MFLWLPTPFLVPMLIQCCAYWRRYCISRSMGGTLYIKKKRKCIISSRARGSSLTWNHPQLKRLQSLFNEYNNKVSKTNLFFLFRGIIGIFGGNTPLRHFDTINLGKYDFQNFDGHREPILCCESTEIFRKLTLENVSLKIIWFYSM